MGSFATLVNGQKPLTIVVKLSILDGCGVLATPPLEIKRKESISAKKVSEKSPPENYLFYFE